MSGYVDVPGRAARYVCSVVPGAPDVPGGYGVLAVLLDPRCGVWTVAVRASWGTGSDVAGVSVDVPLRVLLEDRYVPLSESGW